MANSRYRLNSGTGSDLLKFQDGATAVYLRVRPGEVVEVDLADGAQDTAFNQAIYTEDAPATLQHKLKPSA
jgi:hypothetical protein